MSQIFFVIFMQFLAILPKLSPSGQLLMGNRVLYPQYPQFERIINVSSNFRQ